MSMNEYYRYRRIEAIEDAKDRNRRVKAIVRGGWYFGYVPKWVVEYFNELSSTVFHYGNQRKGTINRVGIYTKGGSYEYWTVTLNGKISSIVKREL